MKLKVFFFLILIALFFFSCTPPEKEYKLEKGYIDLSNWDFNSGEVDLRGDWEFYWQKFYTSDDFKNNNIQPTYYVELPSLWNKFQTDSFKIKSEGYATIRLNVKLPDDIEEILALRLGRIETSSRLYVNGQLLKEVGSPGTSVETTDPYWDRTNIEFFCDTNHLEIILQIANFHHKKIGVSGTFILGNLETVTKKGNKVNYFNIFLIGVLIIIAMYHFGLFVLRKEDKVSLLFAIFSLNVAIVSFFYGDVMMGKIFPWISWKISVNVLFLSYFTAMISFTLFVYNLFQNHFNKKVIYSLMLIQVVFSLITIFTPVKVFSHLMIPFQISAVGTLIYLLIGLIIASIKKDEGAVFSALALFIFIASAVNDILFDAVVISSIYLLSVGTFSFVFLQSFTISLRFSRLFSKNEELTSELNEINKNLEKKVLERTAKIETQKEELRVQAENLQEINHEINQQKEELQTQSEVLEKANIQIMAKNEKIQKQNNDITSSIIYAKRIQNALLPPESMFKEFFSDYFIFYKPKNIVSGDFYWAKKINNKLLIAVADCTGHGVPGAFVSMLGISILNEIVRKNEINSTDSVLNSFREQIKISLSHKNNDNELKDGMDMTFCSIDLHTNELEFSGANNPMYIIRQKNKSTLIDINSDKNAFDDNNILCHIQPDKQPIGEYFFEKEFSKQNIKLEKNDQLVFFTDGYYDQFGGDADKRKYYSRNFKQLLLSIYPQKLSEQKNVLLNEFEDWKASNIQTDDVLVIGLKL